MTDQEAAEHTEFALRRIQPVVQRFQKAAQLLTSCMGPGITEPKHAWIYTDAVKRLEQLERAVRDTRETINNIARETLR